ncbi:MAG: hypothetical protein AAF628_36705 [Planctomycetota bacterium]
MLSATLLGLLAGCASAPKAEGMYRSKIARAAVSQAFDGMIEKLEKNDIDPTSLRVAFAVKPRNVEVAYTVGGGLLGFLKGVAKNDVDKINVEGDHAWAYLPLGPWVTFLQDEALVCAERHGMAFLTEDKIANYAEAVKLPRDPRALFNPTSQQKLAKHLRDNGVPLTGLVTLTFAGDKLEEGKGTLEVGVRYDPLHTGVGTGWSDRAFWPVSVKPASVQKLEPDLGEGVFTSGTIQDIEARFQRGKEQKEEKQAEAGN